MKKVLILIAIFYSFVILIGCKCTMKYELWWTDFRIIDMENLDGNPQFNDDDTSRKVYFSPKIELKSISEEVSYLPLQLTKSSYAMQECDEEYKEMNFVSSIEVFLLSDSLDSYKMNDNISDLFVATAKESNSPSYSLIELIDKIENSNVYPAFWFYLKFKQVPEYIGRFEYKISIKLSNDKVITKNESVYLID